MSRHIPIYHRILETKSAKLNYCNVYEKQQKNCLNGGKCLTIIVNNVDRFPTCLCSNYFIGENCNKIRNSFNKNVRKNYRKSSKKIPSIRSINLESSLNRNGTSVCMGELRNSICLNGGTCLNITYFNRSSEIICQCANGYDGKYCGYKIIKIPVPKKVL